MEHNVTCCSGTQHEKGHCDCNCCKNNGCDCCAEHSHEDGDCGCGHK